MRNLLACLGCIGMLSLAYPSAAEEHVVSIRSYRFEPSQIRIRVGDTVRWLNKEKRTSHSVLFSGSPGLESERLFPGESWSRRFDAPGRIEYGCGPHPEMSGTIEITE
jgi:plastocyanin